MVSSASMGDMAAINAWFKALSHLMMCTLQRRLLRHTCLTFWHLSWAAPNTARQSVQEAISTDT